MPPMFGGVSSLTAVDSSGRRNTSRERYAIASSTAARQKLVSSEIETRQLSARRVAQSITTATAR